MPCVLCDASCRVESSRIFKAHQYTRKVWRVTCIYLSCSRTCCHLQVAQSRFWLHFIAKLSAAAPARGPLSIRARQRSCGPWQCALFLCWGTRSMLQVPRVRSALTSCPGNRKLLPPKLRRGVRGRHFRAKYVWIVWRCPHCVGNVAGLVSRCWRET